MNRPGTVLIDPHTIPAPRDATVEALALAVGHMVTVPAAMPQTVPAHTVAGLCRSLSPVPVGRVLAAHGGRWYGGKVLMADYRPSRRQEDAEAIRLLGAAASSDSGRRAAALGDLLVLSATRAARRSVAAPRTRGEAR